MVQPGGFIEVDHRNLVGQENIMYNKPVTCNKEGLRDGQVLKGIN